MVELSNLIESRSESLSVIHESRVSPSRQSHLRNLGNRSGDVSLPRPLEAERRPMLAEAPDERSLDGHGAISRTASPQHGFDRFSINRDTSPCGVCRRQTSHVWARGAEVRLARRPDRLEPRSHLNTRTQQVDTWRLSRCRRPRESSERWVRTGSCVHAPQRASARGGRSRPGFPPLPGGRSRRRGARTSPSVDRSHR